MSDKVIGYICVSTYDQNSERQLDGMPLDKIFTDKASGKDLKPPAFGELLDYVRDGDTVLVHSIDRLARNLDHLRQVVRELTTKEVKVQFVKERLTFTGEDSPMATLLLTERTLQGTQERSGREKGNSCQGV